MIESCRHVGDVVKALWVCIDVVVLLLGWDEMDVSISRLARSRNAALVVVFDDCVVGIRLDFIQQQFCVEEEVHRAVASRSRNPGCRETAFVEVSQSVDLFRRKYLQRVAGRKVEAEVSHVGTGVYFKLRIEGLFEESVPIERRRIPDIK
jgi:hypothetical protein